MYYKISVVCCILFCTGTCLLCFILNVIDAIQPSIAMHYLSLKRHSSITNVLMFCEPVACKTTAVSVTYSS